MIIDGHTHLFTMDTQQYPLANPASVYRPETEGSAEKLKQEMQEVGVDRALTITTGFYGWDNSYSMDQLEDNADWLAVGVLVDPTSPEAPDQLESLVDQGACGLRIQRHLFYHQALDDPISTPLWARAADLDLTVDINATQDEYDSVERRIRQFPETRFILDHCGYVSSVLMPPQNTVDAVIHLARYPNVYAKLTFLPLASNAGYPFRDVHWMVHEIVKAFGPDRCLFGCNFPTNQFSPDVSYAQIVQLFADEIELSNEERAWVMGGTASILWQWKE
jgi:predicted TIM-barrel fold metal-dependent hydrolase